MFNLFQEQFWAIQPDALEAYYLAWQNLQANKLLSEQFSNEPPQNEQQNNGVKIATINLSGIISKHSLYNSYSGEKLSTGLNDLQKQVSLALADPECEIILLDIYSPGGTVSGVKEFADYLKAVNKEKTCLAYVDGLCCSAAYWIASACSAIYAPLTATVGSIGVLTKHTDYSKMNEKFGIAYTYIAAGEYKTVGNPDSPLSDQDKAELQKRVDALYQIFVADVTANRQITAEPLLFANGRDFLAQEAKNLGLITDIVVNKEELITKFQGGYMDKQNENQASNEALANAALSSETVTGEVLALVKLVAGEENHNKIVALLNSGMNAKQVNTAMEIFGQAKQIASQEPAKVQGEAQNRAQSTSQGILDQLKALTPSPIQAEQKLISDENSAALARMTKI